MIMKKYKVLKPFMRQSEESELSKFNDDFIKLLVDNGYIKEESSLPKTWEELETVKGWYVNTISGVDKLISPTHYRNKNIFPTQEEAEACLALSQLCQLRDRYNGQPLSEWCVWTDSYQVKYIICFDGDEINTDDTYEVHEVLAFKTEELRGEFLNNFKDLILTAKPLL